MLLIKTGLQFGTKILILSFLLILFTTNGCKSKLTDLNSIDSDKVDSLIRIFEINERTVIVKFGYDAVTAIKTSNGIVLIDAGISTFLTEKYKKLIESHFNIKNFCYLINSHGHHDHVRGNILFPQTRILGHENCIIDAPESRTNKDSLLIRIGKTVSDYDDQLQHSTPDTEEWDDCFTQKIRYSSAYNDVKKNIPFRFPDLTFSDSTILYCGDTSFEMIYFGEFHSNSDILIYVPEIHLLFTGDLFSKYGRPGMSNSSVHDENRWIHAVNWTNKRINDFQIIIDGHGQILTIDDLQRFYYSLLKDYPEKKPADVKIKTGRL